ncbi:thioredoxin family protein [Candidatus Woesearchaeota archaeon]|nr:thioredoxin family protein [Candidatus Woesearchaeota archaeon]
MKPSAVMLIAVLAALAVAVAGCSSGNGKSGVSDANAGASSGADAEGSLLAGSESGAKYYEYRESAYKQALADGKIVYLEFHATWCPICREQEPHIFSAFNSLENPGVVGFRVNYDREAALKREFNVAYQHTRVIIKDGKVVKKASDFWNSDRIRSELEKAAA